MLRPTQWIKNIFVLAPLFFSGEAMDVSLIVYSMVAFISFALASSAIYCLNDIVDYDADRMHPRKSHRPVASGRVTRVDAAILSCLLAATSLLLPLAAMTSAASTLMCSAVIGVYLLLNVAYSLWLRNVAIVDVFVVAFGFVLRVLAGAAITMIVPTPWILIFTFTLTLFLVLAKRRDDHNLGAGSKDGAHPTSAHYSLAFIDHVLTMLATVNVLGYIMYCLSEHVTSRANGQYLYTTSIFVLAGIIRYLQLTVIHNATGSPTRTVLHDRFLIVCFVLWVMSFGMILYL